MQQSDLGVVQHAGILTLESMDLFPKGGSTCRNSGSTWSGIYIEDSEIAVVTLTLPKDI